MCFYKSQIVAFLEMHDLLFNYISQLRDIFSHISPKKFLVIFVEVPGSADT